jgi:hypothetical protein
MKDAARAARFGGALVKLKNFSTLTLILYPS